MRTVVQRAALVILMAGLLGAAKMSAGSILFSPDPIDTAAPDLDKKVSVSDLEKKSDGWTLYFVAYLKRPPGSPDVNLVFYDAAQKGHEPTSAFPISTQPSVKILSSSVSFGTDQGFQPGHRYNVLLTRLVGGREEVYARGSIALK